MSINLKVADYCKNCDEFEPDVSKERYQLQNDFMLCSVVMEVETEVTCKHEVRCQSIMRYLKEQLKKETKDETK